MGRGNSGAGGRTEKKIRAELKLAEDSIRNGEHETLIVIGKNGERVYEKTAGERSHVQFEITAEMRDSVMTHNHPGGTCFSAEDLNAAFVTAAREMRACHANGYYSIRRQFEIGDYIDAGYKNFARDYRDAVGNFMKTVTNPRWLRGPKTEELAESLTRDVNDYKRTWLRKHAKAYGWEFTEGGK